MTARARRKTSDLVPAKASKAAPRLAGHADSAAAAPVHHQHLRLQAAFSAPTQHPYPPAVKLAIFVGAPIALWAGVILGGAQLLKMIAH
ncbi:MAG: hypothetical protein P4L64_01425 [Caulobacteraceae bacterium]|nr:hypothetical protein [Caulobacteraceae bacterium]